MYPTASSTTSANRPRQAEFRPWFRHAEGLLRATEHAATRRAITQRDFMPGIPLSQFGKRDTKASALGFGGHHLVYQAIGAAGRWCATERSPRPEGHTPELPL